MGGVFSALGFGPHDNMERFARELGAVQAGITAYEKQAEQLKALKLSVQSYTLVITVVLVLAVGVYGYLSRGAPPGDLSKPVLYTLLALVVLVPFGLMRTAAYLVQTQISRAETNKKTLMNKQKDLVDKISKDDGYQRTAKLVELVKTPPVGRTMGPLVGGSTSVNTGGRGSMPPSASASANGAAGPYVQQGQFLEQTPNRGPRPPMTPQQQQQLAQQQFPSQQQQQARPQQQPQSPPSALDRVLNLLVGDTPTGIQDENAQLKQENEQLRKQVAELYARLQVNLPQQTPQQQKVAAPVPTISTVAEPVSTGTYASDSSSEDRDRPASPIQRTPGSPTIIRRSNRSRTPSNPIGGN